MSYKDSGSNFIEQSGISIREYIEVDRSYGGSHLAKVLIKNLFVVTELHAFEIIGIYPHTETVKPFFFIKDRRYSDGFRATSRIATPRLVDKISGEATP